MNTREKKRIELALVILIIAFTMSVASSAFADGGGSENPTKHAHGFLDDLALIADLDVTFTTDNHNTPKQYLDLDRAIFGSCND
jgi:hypothetical protein